MDKREVVSVVIIAFWKADRLIDLVASVLPQLGADDEILIVVEQPVAGVPSNMTREVAQEIARQVPIARVITSEKRGKNAGFEQAIRSSKGEVVFLAEPGDIWKAKKVEAVLGTLSEGEQVLAIHDAELFVPMLERHYPSFFSMAADKSDLANHHLRYTFMGSCMAFRKPLHELFLPFPDDDVVYGQWIGLVAEEYGGVALLINNLAIKTIDEKTDSLSIITNMSNQKSEQKRLLKILKKREKEMMAILQQWESRHKRD